MKIDISRDDINIEWFGIVRKGFLEDITFYGGCVRKPFLKVHRRTSNINCNRTLKNKERQL